MRGLPADEAQERAFARSAFAGGEVSLDPTGKKPGRGAYCCYSADCLKRALKQGQLDRQLEVKLTPEVNQSLTETMNRLLEESKA